MRHYYFAKKIYSKLNSCTDIAPKSGPVSDDKHTIIGNLDKIILHETYTSSVHSNDTTFFNFLNFYKVNNRRNSEEVLFSNPVQVL